MNQSHFLIQSPFAIELPLKARHQMMCKIWAHLSPSDHSSDPTPTENRRRKTVRDAETYFAISGSVDWVDRNHGL